MDDKDRRILEMLRANARLPLKTIAGSVGLARSSVADRIERLEEAGVIQGYGARLAPAADGTVGAVLLLRLARTPLPDTVARITAIPEVRRCFSLSGEIDLLVEVAASNAASLNAIRDRISTDPAVVRLTTSLILKREKDD